MYILRILLTPVFSIIMTFLSTLRYFLPLSASVIWDVPLPFSKMIKLLLVLKIIVLGFLRSLAMSLVDHPSTSDGIGYFGMRDVITIGSQNI